LGLRNSSNRGEKVNDLVVSERQKHNGMSWSPEGSVALAAAITLARNQGQGLSIILLDNHKRRRIGISTLMVPITSLNLRRADMKSTETYLTRLWSADFVDIFVSRQ